MRIRTYTELKQLASLKYRFEYLKLSGDIGVSTFGFDRYLNQAFYHSSPEWKKARDYVIVRDNGCDLGVDGEQIFDRLIVHHMNPVTMEQLENGDPVLVDPEFLICCRARTHNAIHFGDERLLPSELVIRKPNDTCPWK